MPKPIDLELLELALWQAYHKYVSEKPPDRPMRAPCKVDVTAVADALRATRHSWSMVRSGGETASFAEMKRRVLNGLQHDKGWKLETRNLYSSAISVYMSWDRGRLTIKPETYRLLTALRAVGLAMQEEKDG